MRTSAPPLLAIFRSQLQGELLAQIFLGAAGRETVTDLARALQAPVATVHREVTRLVAAGVLTTTRVGRALQLSANDDNPAVRPLRELVLIAFGPRQVVAEEFANMLGIEEIAIFGSWAARYLGEVGAVPDDVDVLVVGVPDRDDVFEASERASRRLRREVNATIVSPPRWASGDEPFLRQVRSRPRVCLRPGDENATSGDQTRRQSEPHSIARRAVLQ